MKQENSFSPDSSSGWVAIIAEKQQEMSFAVVGWLSEPVDEHMFVSPMIMVKSRVRARESFGDNFRRLEYVGADSAAWREACQSNRVSESPF